MLVKRALVSWYDKTRLLEFAVRLRALGVRILSTGGTAKALEAAGIPCILVEAFTGAAEMLDGRVKSLHPRIHGAILADRGNPDHMAELRRQGIETIDLVSIVPYAMPSLSPGDRVALEGDFEWIDIGGPSALRAAAKNFRHVWPAVGTAAAFEVLAALEKAPEEANALRMRARMSADVFEHLAGYNREIAAFLRARVLGEIVPPAESTFASEIKLRYGENPHQAAWLMPEPQSRSLVQPLGGWGGWSYNNCLDLDAGIGLCRDLVQMAGSAAGDRFVVFIKHGTPCGAGGGATLAKAYDRAYLGDPQSAMGGVLVCSDAVTEDFAAHVMATLDRVGKAAGAAAFFVDVWAAPSFDSDSMTVIRRAKNWGERIRLATAAVDMSSGDGLKSYRSTAMGMLAQTADDALTADWRAVTQRMPTEDQWNALRFAWVCGKHARSNAVCLVVSRQMVGCGAGQTSRVIACRTAIEQARAGGHLREINDLVAASDGFFPFPDSVEQLASAGVKAVIQPGGSKNDDRVIEACDRVGIAMVLTGVRAFRH